MGNPLVLTPFGFLEGQPIAQLRPRNVSTGQPRPKSVLQR